MSNLAYKRYEFDEDPQEIIKEESVDIKIIRAEKRKNIKMFLGMVSYGLVFLIVGSVYVNLIMSKTEYNMKMAKLKTEKNKILIEMNKIKADTDIKVDYRKIEEIAKGKLGMEISDEIKYVQFK